MAGETCATWRNPRVILVLSLVFLCGMLTGGVAMRFGLQHLADKQAGASADKDAALVRLTEELDLDHEQAQRLEVVLDDFVKYVQMLQAQMDEVRANGKDRILVILNDEQKKKFEKMLTELQARH